LIYPNIFLAGAYTYAQHVLHDRLQLSLPANYRLAGAITQFSPRKCVLLHPAILRLDKFSLKLYYRGPLQSN